MKIDGLTEFQVNILDELWGCKTVEEMHKYMQNKSEDELKEIITLRELLILAHIDEEINEMPSYPDSEELLRNIMK